METKSEAERPRRPLRSIGAVFAGLLFIFIVMQRSLVGSFRLGNTS